MVATRRALSRLVAGCQSTPSSTVAGWTPWTAGFASMPATAEAAERVHSKEGKVLHPDLIAENFRKCQYAVRGELYLRAEQLRQQGREIIFTNVGNPHALGQQPITFYRQVLALLTCPTLLNDPRTVDLFPADVVARAKKMMGSEFFPGGLGAYSDSRGAPGVRAEVADFITKRDGFPADPNHVFLSDGASVSVRTLLHAIIRDENDGLFVPIPQYPLYSASIQLYGGKLVPYYLDETKGWGLNIAGLQSALTTAQSQGIDVRGMVFINPGNPTGQCLSADNLRELIRFAYDHKIVLMADEVYQENVYQDERPFVSARKVMYEMGEPYSSGVELASFHTISKGTPGECGLRGGYMELVNMHPGTIEEIYKYASINLCPNTTGQAAMSLMMHPPQPGDESYPLFAKERSDTLASLRRRAHMMTDGFNALEGVTCNFTEGAMYSFPRLNLPPKAVEAAKAAGKAPDVFYCLKLLEATGISTVPGSGFGQEEGTFHLRTTILPLEDKIVEVVDKFSGFHKQFMDQYR